MKKTIKKNVVIKQDGKKININIKVLPKKKKPRKYKK